jgi:hypothetical protein
MAGFDTSQYRILLDATFGNEVLAKRLRLGGMRRRIIFDDYMGAPARPLGADNQSNEFHHRASSVDHPRCRSDRGHGTGLDR